MTPDLEATLRGVPCRFCGVLHYGQMGYNPSDSMLPLHEFRPDFPAMALAVREAVEKDTNDLTHRLEKIALWFGMVKAHAGEYGSHDLALGHIEEALRGISGDALLERLADSTRDQMISALRAEVEKEKADHAHTLQASSEMENALRERLKEVRAEVERLKRLVATMTPTEAYDAIYRALEHQDVEVERLTGRAKNMQESRDLYFKETERLRAALIRWKERRKDWTPPYYSLSLFDEMMADFDAALAPPPTGAEGEERR